MLAEENGLIGVIHTPCDVMIFPEREVGPYFCDCSWMWVKNSEIHFI